MRIEIKVMELLEHEVMPPCSNNSQICT